MYRILFIVGFVTIIFIIVHLCLLPDFEMKTSPEENNNLEFVVLYAD